MAIASLKVLTSPDPELRRRLLDEARVQARLRHPHICPVFELGESPQGPFIATLMDEDSLQRWARKTHGVNLEAA